MTTNVSLINEAVGILEFLSAGDLEIVQNRVKVIRDRRRKDEFDWCIGYTYQEIRNIAAGACRANIRNEGKEPNTYSPDEALDHLDAWAKREENQRKIAATWALWHNASDAKAFAREWDAWAAKDREAERIIAGAKL